MHIVLAQLFSQDTLCHPQQPDYDRRSYEDAEHQSANTRADRCERVAEESRTDAGRGRLPEARQNQERQIATARTRPQLGQARESFP